MSLCWQRQGCIGVSLCPYAGKGSVTLHVGACVLNASGSRVTSGGVPGTIGVSLYSY